MLAMVLLTFGVLVKLFCTRLRFTRRGEIDVKYFRTYQSGSEPEASAKLARNFVNLLETPTLFYVACLGALATDASSLLMSVLAWSYVAFRLTHTWVHAGANRLRPRIATYFASWIILLLMWIALAAT